MQRRTKFVNKKYLDKVLLPMHEQYVEPTKELADLVIDVNNKSAQEVKEISKSNLREFLIS